MTLSPEEIREKIREKRQSFQPKQISDFSLTLCRRLSVALIPVSRRGLRIGVYRAVAGEVDLRPFETAFRRTGARFFFPRIPDRRTSEMEFVEMKPDSASAKWKIGPFGIAEPAPEMDSAPPEELDLVIVPGAAFGMGGERIGMGAGFYDRFLPRATRALRVALAMDFQLFPGLPQAQWDQRMDWIISESCEIKASKALTWG